MTQEELETKYQPILDAANSNGTTYELQYDPSVGVLHINGTAPSDEALEQLKTAWGSVDPDYTAGDLVLSVTAGAGGGANTYTVEHGDSLSAIGAKYGISWHSIYEANKALIGDNPDMIQPGQELTIPSA